MVGQPDVSVELVKYRSLNKYTPKVGDVIIFMGWFSKWFGVVSAINKTELIIIKDGLPSLVFTMDESNYKKNTVEMEAGEIIDSSPGAYSIIQDGVWYVHG